MLTDKFTLRFSASVLAVLTCFLAVFATFFVALVPDFLPLDTFFGPLEAFLACLGALPTNSASLPPGAKFALKLRFCAISNCFLISGNLSALDFNKRALRSSSFKFIIFLFVTSNICYLYYIKSLHFFKFLL